MLGLEVLVVGGGQAGLAMGYHLRRRGRSVQIVDAGPEVGHIWKSRWDSLRLFTPTQYSGLPGMPFPGAHDSYPTKNQVAEYLRGYASMFRLDIRPNTTVTGLRRARRDFLIDTTDPTVTFRAPVVVAATGPFQVPVIPDVAAGLDPAVLQLHSSRYRNPGQLPDGPVVVVGGGNSGFQIAAELAATHPVDLAIGTRNVSVPQRPMGRDIFWWQTATGLINAASDSRRGRWMRRGEGTVIGLSAQDLRRSGVTFRPRLTETNGRRVGFADGTSTEITSVVWATGFRRDYSWITEPGAFTTAGDLDHHRGVTPVGGLYVLGQPWQHTTGSALLGFVQHDAAYLADHIDAYLAR